MKAQFMLIECAKKAGAIRYYVDLAAKLGVTEQTVSQWRNGEVPLSDERVEQIAEMSGEDPGKWVLAIKAERTKSAAVRASLQRILAQWKDAPALLLIAVMSAGAMPKHAVAQPCAHNQGTLYIMSVLRRLWRLGICHLPFTRTAVTA